MTDSQNYLRQAEACDVELRKIQKQIDGLECIARSLCDEERYAREQYRLFYKEELESRRNYVLDQNPRLKSPNVSPNINWKAWRATSDRVSKAWSKQVGGKYHLLLMRLSRFAQEMMGITNTQAWNPRNPNPHLP